MTFSRDFIVGMFVIAAFVILTIVTVFLRHWDPFNRQDTYYILSPTPYG
jgi:hypothetical protein